MSKSSHKEDELVLSCSSSGEDSKTMEQTMKIPWNNPLKKKINLSEMLRLCSCVVFESCSLLDYSKTDLEGEMFNVYHGQKNYQSHLELLCDGKHSLYRQLYKEVVDSKNQSKKKALRCTVTDSAIYSAY